MMQLWHRLNQSFGETIQQVMVKQKCRKLGDVLKRLTCDSLNFVLTQIDHPQRK